MADFFETREIPQIGEILALLGFYGLHGAGFALEEDAGAVRLFLQRQALAVMAEPRELLDEIVLGHSLVGGETRNFGIRQPNLPGPAAAGGAALAFQEDGHTRLEIFQAPTPEIKMIERHHHQGMFDLAQCHEGRDI